MVAIQQGNTSVAPTEFTGLLGFPNRMKPSDLQGLFWPCWLLPTLPISELSEETPHSHRPGAGCQCGWWVDEVLRARSQYGQCR